MRFHYSTISKHLRISMSQTHVHIQNLRMDKECIWKERKNNLLLIDVDKYGKIFIYKIYYF